MNLNFDETETAKEDFNTNLEEATNISPEELGLEDETINNDNSDNELNSKIARYKYIYEVFHSDTPISESTRAALHNERQAILMYIHNKIEKYIHKIIHNGYSSVINDIPVYDKFTKTQTYSDEYNEAFTEALTAIYEELHKFDPEKGVFQKFCIARIFHALSEYTCKHITGKPSKYYAANAKAVKDAKRALIAEGYSENQITLSLLQEKTGLSPVMIKNALMIDQRSNFVNIDSDDKNVTITSFGASPEEIYFKKEKQQRLFSLLDVLNPLEKAFIYYKFIEKDFTYQEIGCMPDFIDLAKTNEYHVPISSGNVKIKHDTKFYPEYISLSDIREIEDNALKKLRTTHAFRELYKTGSPSQKEELTFETTVDNEDVINALMSLDVDVVEDEDFQF